MKSLKGFAKIFSLLIERGDFFLLALFVVAINWPYFSSTIIPQHDSMYNFQLFYFFYNNWFWHGEIAQWMPLDTFGLPTNHDQLAFISPVSYLAMFLGRIFQVHDVLWLLKMTVLAEQLLFLLGMYWLCRLIFSKRITTFFICVAAVNASNWYAQLFFDFRIFYLFPLAAYFLVLFFRKRKGRYLWLMAITVMAWEMGNVIYFIFLWFFIFAVIGIVFFLQDRSIRQCRFERRVPDIVLFVLCLVLYASFFFIMKDLMGFIDLVARGPGGRNPLSVWIHWGGVDGIREFITNSIRGDEYARYVGLLPLVFFIWALFKVRIKLFWPFLAGFAVLFWFSFGGTFSVLCYYFPLLAYYRHIGLVYGLLKILLLICAGFGLDHFLASRWQTKMRASLLGAAVLIFSVDILRISGDWFTKIAFTKAPFQNLMADITSSVLTVRVGGYLLALVFILLLGAAAYFLRKFFRREISPSVMDSAIVLLLGAAFVVDIVSFHFGVYGSTPKLPKEYEPLVYAFQVNELKYPSQRVQEPSEKRQRDALTLVSWTAPSKYSAAYSFMQFDTCHTTFYKSIYPAGFSRLTGTRQGITPDLFRVLGCFSPKMRLMTKTKFFEKTEEISSFLKATPAISDTLILRGQENLAGSKAFAEGCQPNVAGGVAVKHFSANQLTAEVDVPCKEGAWLVYADSFHPGWHATVNGKKVPVFEAYLTFKAVPVGEGKNLVQFSYHNGMISWMMYVFVVFGTVASVVLLLMFCVTVFFNSLPVVWTKRDSTSS